MTVRRAEQGDARAIAAVHVRAWHEAYRELSPEEVLERFSDMEERTRSWHELLDESHGRWFTLVALGPEGRVEGFCAATPRRDNDAGDLTAEIAATYVDPECWRAGVGAALLEAALARLRQDGYEQVTLWVFADNERARSFYRRFGFEPDGAEDRHDCSWGQLEIRLRAALTRRDQRGPPRSPGERAASTPPPS